MFTWVAAGVCVWFAAVALVRCAKDGHASGVAFAAVAAVLVVLERLWPNRYFVLVGAAAAAAAFGLVTTHLRERGLSAARTSQRDLVTPFLVLAGATLGGVIVSLLAHSLSGP